MTYLFLLKIKYTVDFLEISKNRLFGVETFLIVAYDIDGK